MRWFRLEEGGIGDRDNKAIRIDVAWYVRRRDDAAVQSARHP